MTRVTTNSSKTKDKRPKFCILERMQKRQYQDHKAIMIVFCGYSMKRVTYTLYSTWCIMICLVIQILSLQSLSKLLANLFSLVYTTADYNAGHTYVETGKPEILHRNLSSSWKV